MAEPDGESPGARRARLAEAIAGASPADWPGLVARFASGDDLAEMSDLLRTALDEAVEAHPDAPALYIARGDAQRGLGRLSGAIDEYAYAAELAPADAEAWHRLAEARWANDEPGAAADALERAVEARPGDAALLLRLAEALNEADEPTQAIAVCEEALEDHPSIAGFYRERARAALTMALPEDALDDCQAALAHDPGDAASSLVQAQALFDLERDDEARASVDAALRLSPDDLDALRLRGDILLGLGDLGGAEATFRRILDLAPDDASTRVGLGEVHLARGEHEAAAEIAREAIAGDPGASDGYVVLARAQRAAGDALAARDTLGEGLELVDLPADLYLERALLHEEAGHLNLAWRDARWAIEADSTLVAAYVLRGRLAFRIESPSEALADLDAALDLDPDHGEALAWRGRARAMTGDRAGALDDWHEAEGLLADGAPLRAEIDEWRRALG